MNGELYARARHYCVTPGGLGITGGFDDGGCAHGEKKTSLHYKTREKFHETTTSKIAVDSVSSTISIETNFIYFHENVSLTIFFLYSFFQT